MSTQFKKGGKAICTGKTDDSLLVVGEEYDILGVRDGTITVNLADWGPTPIYKKWFRPVPERVEVGGYVTPVACNLTAVWGERWRGVFEVLSVDKFGYGVRGNDGVYGTFRFDLAERAERPALPEFSLQEAQRGLKLKFRSGCPVVFVAYLPSAKPHCRLVLLNPNTGNVVTRYENGRPHDEPAGHQEPGDILIDRS